LQVTGLLSERGGHHNLVLGHHRLGVVALHDAPAGRHQAAVGIGGVGNGPRVGRLITAARLDVRPRLPALGPGRRGQLRDPNLVAVLAFGGLGFQPRLGLLEAGQPPAGAGELGWELIAPGGAVLQVLGLVGLGRFLQDLGDLLLELDQRAVGSLGGVGGHLGAVQRDQAEADQPGRSAPPQRGDQEAGQACWWRTRKRAMVTWSGSWLPASTRKARSSMQRRWIWREERTPMA
jgi:hypothetical protein